MRKDKNKESLLGLLLIEHEDRELAITYFISLVLVFCSIVFGEILGPFIITGDMILDATSFIVVFAGSLIFAWPISGIMRLIIYIIRKIIISLRGAI